MNPAISRSIFRLASLAVPMLACAAVAAAQTPVGPAQPVGEQPAPGNQSAVRGGAMRQDWVWSDSVYPIATLGGAFPLTTTYAWHTFNRTFTDTTVPGQNPLQHLGPVINQLVFSANAGSDNDAVSVMTICGVQVTSKGCFGGNDIVFSVPKITPKLVGREIDLQYTPDDLGTGGGGGLFINEFNIPTAVPAIYIDAQSGSWGDGVKTAQIRGAHYSVAGDNITTSLEFIDTSQGRFSNGAIVLGTGPTQAIAFGTGGPGVSPYLYGDPGNVETLQLGAGGQLAIRSPANTTQFTFDGAGNEVAKGTVTAAAIATAASAFANLPASPVVGERGFVTDAGACQFNQAVAGGAPGHGCPVVYNGSAWVAG